MGSSIGRAVLASWRAGRWDGGDGPDHVVTLGQVAVIAAKILKRSGWGRRQIVREWCECHSELHLVTTPPTRSTAALRAEGLRSLLARVTLGLHRPAFGTSALGIVQSWHAREQRAGLRGCDERAGAALKQRAAGNNAKQMREKLNTATMRTTDKDAFCVSPRSSRMHLCRGVVQQVTKSANKTAITPRLSSPSCLLSLCLYCGCRLSLSLSLSHTRCGTYCS